MAERTQRAIVACGRFLAECVRLGWDRSKLDALESLWWEHHDERGNLKQPGPWNADGVAATAKTADGGCNSTQDTPKKDPALCAWPGCAKPTGSPVMAYCRSHRGGPIPHG